MGEIIGDSADRRVEIVAERDDVHATISRFGPGRDGADLHIHRRHHDVFYVVSGELTLKLDGGEQVVGAGNFVRVPPMVAHGFRNGGDVDLTYVNLHLPGVGFADYLRGLRDRVRVPFDQEDPPESGLRPSSAIHVGPGPVTVGSTTLSAADGVVCAGDVRIAV